MRRITPLLLPLLLAACGQSHGPASDAVEGAARNDALPTAPLRVTTATGDVRPFTVEIAATAAEQQRGLMHRKTLAAGHGMAFPFAPPRTASFWMKDTPLPLDLLFVRPDGTIAAILPGKPLDLHPISAGEPVSAVIEIAGGSARALGISAGDHVQWGDCPLPAASHGQAEDGRAFCPPPR